MKALLVILINLICVSLIAQSDTLHYHSYSIIELPLTKINMFTSPKYDDGGSVIFNYNTKTVELMESEYTFAQVMTLNRGYGFYYFCNKEAVFVTAFNNVKYIEHRTDTHSTIYWLK